MTASNGAALETALVWFHARNAHDLATVMSVAGDDIVVDSPGFHVEGSDEFRGFEGGFLPMITGAKLIAGFGGDDSALLMYDLATPPVPSSITAAHVTVTDGKITGLRIVYDQMLFANL